MLVICNNHYSDYIIERDFQPMCLKFLKLPKFSKLLQFATVMCSFNVSAKPN